MIDPYVGREQTKAKHFILKRYLQELAFKILNFSDLTYVDGFSGPWETRAQDFADSSFKIAISVLQDAQARMRAKDGKLRRIRCFFVESDPATFEKLRTAVEPYNRPEEAFEVVAHCGKFEEAINDIQSFIGSSFAIIFVDPTGWTGYSFDKIKTLFMPNQREVLINFMYEFVNRFAYSDDESIVASLDSILGGPGWRERLDPSLHRGLAVEQLFRDTLKAAGRFAYVVSTKIDKATADRPHFFIAYGTKSRHGLKAFRETEFAALRAHEKNRANAKERARENQLGIRDMFSGHHAEVQEETIDDLVVSQKASASARLLALLERRGALTFSDVVAELLQSHVLRETNVKDICVDLARTGRIDNTWGPAHRKPVDENIIRLTSR